MCLYQALPHAKIPLVPTNGNSSTETTTGSPGASAVYFTIQLNFFRFINQIISVHRQVERVAITNRWISRPIKL